MKRSALVILLAAVMIIMTSCLTIQSELNIENDGSGSLKLSYRISRMVQEIGRVDSNNTLVPLPVNEEDFRGIVEESEEITLNDFSYSSDAEYIYIEADLNFSSARALSLLLGGAAGDNVVFNADEGTYTLTQRIYEGLGGPISEDSDKMLETYFNNDSVRCLVTTESDIRDAGIGRIGDNTRTALYEASISEIVRSQTPVTFTVRW